MPICIGTNRVASATGIGVKATPVALAAELATTLRAVLTFSRKETFWAFCKLSCNSSGKISLITFKRVSSPYASTV